MIKKLDLAVAVPPVCPHVVIEDVQPSVDGGRYPVKRIAGRPCTVRATLFRDGHAPLRAVLQWRPATAPLFAELPMTLVNPGLDLWEASFVPEQPGLHLFTIEARTEVDALRAPVFKVVVDPPRAAFGSWYEMFPRSEGGLRAAERRFPDLQRMGFDVLYLPPIHPIGRTGRKGPNNRLSSDPGDPGSPWAIGSGEGGHDAIDPELGTLEDFDHFVAEAARHGLEIALDFALQCSPDHPWVRDYPQWFFRHPDGTLRIAENPPKKYEDITPLNFDTPDRAGLWREILRVLEFWIARGVRIFRVDNPHTKPACFWEWLIATLKGEHPDLIFLAEAFTRPPMMKTLAKLGFTQSYTYFTWRNTKAEIAAYVSELAGPGMIEYFRPNFFVNTPDLLPAVLVEGGPAAFRMRAVLAATLSPSWGLYSGYELCENRAIPHHAVAGDFEYADSEKYQIRARDWDAPGNIKEFIARLNALRRENPALQELSNVRFLDTDDDAVLAYRKATGDNALTVVVNLDPHRARDVAVAAPPGSVDLLTGMRVEGSGRLEPGGAIIVKVHP